MKGHHNDILDILVSLIHEQPRDSFHFQKVDCFDCRTMLSWKSLVSTTANFSHGCRRWGKAAATVIPMSELSNGICHYGLPRWTMQLCLGGVRGAKKKAGGSSTNGRESAGRRLGIKVWPNTFASEC
jgi:Ribosomal L27 protein